MFSRQAPWICQEGMLCESPIADYIGAQDAILRYEAVGLSMLFLTLLAEPLVPLDGIPRFVRSQATKFSYVRLSKNAIPMQWIGRDTAAPCP